MHAILQKLLDFFRTKPKAQPQKPRMVPAPTTPPPQLLTKLEMDMLRYKGRAKLGALEAHELEQEMNKTYAGQALGSLLEVLSRQPGASSYSEALSLLEDACKQLSMQYPIKWVVTNQQMTKFDTTVRFRLLGHNVWINDNGAYRIVQLEGKRLNDDDEIEVFRQGGIVTISKPNANGVDFVQPEGYADGTE